MSFGDLFVFALRALLGHRLRSGLSLTGMSIGVAAVVLLTSLGEGARRYVVDQFSSIGSNLLIVLPGRNETTGFMPGVGGVPNDLTLKDAQAVLRGVPEIVKAAPVVAASESVAFEERRRSVAILGTTAEMIEIQDFRVARGTFLPEMEWDRGSQVAVLGSDTARELFGAQDPIGRRIRIGDRRARVIGVLADRGTQLGIDFDQVVIIPVQTALQLFNRSSLFRVLCKVGVHSDLDQARSRVIEILVARHHEEDVTVLTQDSVVSTLSTILNALTIALAAIAAVSLSVAGLGIMNVMLVSVAERTGEIGLLKAVGVKRHQILAIFLTEAALLSSTGGLLGLALGLGGVQLIVLAYPVFPAQAPSWAVGAAMVVALGFGVLFGVLPARRATKLDPVVALARH